MLCLIPRLQSGQAGCLTINVAAAAAAAAAAALRCAGVAPLRGVLNIVHGTHDVVNGILDHPDIAAVSFVGGDAAGRYIYGRAAANGKRVQVCF
jgi:malonate-semialdehyde dehydrogenase (acetylating)/methylmalonate-semialdehyde dehydrogenase